MSWPLAISPASDFSLQNLPYGIYSTDSDPSPRIGVAVGDDFVLNLKAISQAGILQNVGASPYLETTTLNDFMGQEASVWKTVRSSLQALLSSPTSPFPSSSTCVEASSSVTMHLPCTIGDYTDFYSSREHATNVGTMVSEYAIIISNSNSNSNSNSIQFNSVPRPRQRASAQLAPPSCWVPRPRFFHFSVWVRRCCRSPQRAAPEERH